MAYIEIKNLKYFYQTAQLQPVKAIDGIDLNIEDGEFVALVGPNGSGKSTLAKLFNGLLKPDEGEILIDGINTKDAKRLFEIRSKVGVVFQNPDNQMIATIIEDDIAFGPENLGLPSAQIRERVDWALRCVGMDGHQRGTPFRLSGGQKQRIAIAGVLAIKPKVMVLDESTAMLDPKGRGEVMEVVRTLKKELNMTVILITHFMEEAAQCDRIIVMDKGKIKMQGGKEIFENVHELKQIGLDIPLCAKIARDLKERGLKIDGGVYDIKTLTEALCR